MLRGFLDAHSDCVLTARSRRSLMCLITTLEIAQVSHTIGDASSRLTFGFKLGARISKSSCLPNFPSFACYCSDPPIAEQFSTFQAVMSHDRHVLYQRRRHLRPFSAIWPKLGPKQVDMCSSDYFNRFPSDSPILLYLLLGLQSRF